MAWQALGNVPVGNMRVAAVNSGVREITTTSHPRQVVRDSDFSWGSASVMTLYSGNTDPYSHRCRFVFYEKQMDFQLIDVDVYGSPADMAVVNPYQRVPVLTDRDLILHETNIINEYLDERFPHPQLMPADPMMRARARQLISTMDAELFSQVDILERNPQLKGADKSRQAIRDQLLTLAPIFAKQKFLLNNEMSMLDVAIAPLLWRLDHYGIKLPTQQGGAVLEYADRIFARPGFTEALTAAEKVMRR